MFDKDRQYTIPLKNDSTTSRLVNSVGLQNHATQSYYIGLYPVQITFMKISEVSRLLVTVFLKLADADV